MGKGTTQKLVRKIPKTSEPQDGVNEEEESAAALRERVMALDSKFQEIVNAKQGKELRRRKARGSPIAAPRTSDTSTRESFTQLERSTSEHQQQQNMKGVDDTSALDQNETSNSSDKRTDTVGVGQSHGRPRSIDRDGACFQLFRTCLIIVIFLILHTLFERYVMIPYRTRWSEDEEREHKRKIIDKICPPGTECNFELNPEWEKYRQ
eukprot:jgi/Bigna1/89137/estExt_fgenesh1_pg.C_440075